VDDVAPDKAFVAYGGDETYRLKPGIEAINLRSPQDALPAREQEAGQVPAARLTI
jgi:hypothetical protein